MIYAFFKFIFYFIGIFIICYEIAAISKKTQIHDFFIKVKTSDSNLKLTTIEAIFIFINIFYFIWAMIGLFSSQWVVFLSLTILSFSGITFKKYINYRIIDSVLSIALILFAILNTYHLHINLKPS